MKASKQTQLILEAYNRGYRVTKEGSVKGIKTKELSLSKNKKGYYSFNIRYDNKVTRVFVHRLQAYQKYGKKLFNEEVLARHLNGDSTDNSWDNILIGTQSDNMMDISEEERISKSLHATSFIRKYNKEEVKKFHKKSKSYKETMEKFHISSKGTLNYILNN